MLLSCLKQQSSIKVDEKHPEKKKKRKKNKIKFKENLTTTKKDSAKWVSGVSIISFIISILITILSINLIHGKSVITALLIVFVIICISLIFDLIGTATTAANEGPYYAMASRKIFGAKRAIIMCRNAEKVSTICCDVVGDICGIISGASTTYIVIMLIGKTSGISIIELIMTGLVASFTVGGKALGKVLAIKYSNYIVYWISFIIEKLLIKLPQLKYNFKINGLKKER